MLNQLGHQLRGGVDKKKTPTLRVAIPSPPHLAENPNVPPPPLVGSFG